MFGPHPRPGLLGIGLLAILALAAAGVPLPGCDAAPAPGPVTPPPPPAASPPPEAAALPADPGFRFTPLRGDATGFGPLNHTGVPGEKQWIAEAMFGGLIVLDHDGDGDMDLFFADGNRVAGEPVEGARARLFRNDGGMKFTEVTREAGIDLTRTAYGGAAVDYDGDGDEDLFVCCLGTNALFRNDGDGTFTEVAAAAGLAGSDRDMSTACGWGDFDGDGRLDVYVSNYIDIFQVVEDFRKEGREGRSCEWRGFKVYCGPGGLPFQNDRLFLQKGDGTFEDVSARLKDQAARPAFQPVVADYDGDGDLDVYVANDTEPNSLWVNDGSAGFRDDAMVAGCAYASTVVPQAGMGVDVADYDGDGLLDIIVTNFSHDHYTLYRNQSRRRKDGSVLLTFEDVSIRSGISQSTYVNLGWAAIFLDPDKDGDPDLFFANGHVYGEIDNFKESGTTYRQANLLLENVRGENTLYRDVSSAAGPGLAVEEVHRGAVMADLDGDGDEDLVVSVLNGEAYVLRNDTPKPGPSFGVLLRGRAPRDPAGARVRVEAEGLPVQTRVHFRGHSFCGSSDPRMFLAAGPTGKARVRVTWPGGAEGVFEGLTAGANYLLEEGVAEASLLPPGGKGK